MQVMLDKFYSFLDRPLVPVTRLVLALLVIPLALSFTRPLWRISMEAPQYPDGLYLDIYSYTLSGGNDGQDLNEINTLNHYIGMHKLQRSEFADLDWIPFALGALIVLALRVAAIGNVRQLVDLCVMQGYVFAFAMVRFVYKLYSFGHDLSKEAPVHVQPFTPAILGSKQIANFTTHSFPHAGTYLAGAFSVGVMLITAYHLVRGRRLAKRSPITEGLQDLDDGDVDRSAVSAVSPAAPH